MGVRGARSSFVLLELGGWGWGARGLRARAGLAGQGPGGGGQHCRVLIRGVTGERNAFNRVKAGSRIRAGQGRWEADAGVHVDSSKGLDYASGRR